MINDVVVLSNKQGSTVAPFTFDCNEPSTLAIVVGSPEYRCMRSRVCFLSLRNSTQELVRGKHAWHGAVGVSRWFMMYRDRRWGIVLFFFLSFLSPFSFRLFFFSIWKYASQYSENVFGICF
jgi:hypothetical protein